MTEASNICQLATAVLKEHTCHPHYHRIGLSGIQGVEAVLTILQECYGWSYPGGLFLAAVDLLLEKEPVVRAVKQQLQRCTGEQTSAQQQEQSSTADSQDGSATASSHSGRHSHPAATGSGPMQAGSAAEADTVSTGRDVSAGSTQLLRRDSLQDEASGEAAQQHEHGQHDWHRHAQAAAPPPPPQDDAGATAADSHSHTPAMHNWHQDGTYAASAEHQQSLSRSMIKSPAGASTASAQRSRSSTPATPPAAHADGVGLPSPKSGSSSKPYAAPGSGGKPVASPISATSPVLLGAAARLAQQQQEQRGKMMDSFQRRQHQQLQHLLFDAPSEVFTASLAGSMRQIDLSAANSPHQIQAQHELQQELSRSSVSSTHAPRHSRHHQQQQQQQHWQPLQEDSGQQQMLPQPQKAQEQQQLQETLQFARQPVHMPPSPVSMWQQWQQQQLAAVPAAASEPGLSPWRLQQLQQQEQNAASPMAVPQPRHKQPPLSPPVQPPHTTSPAVTPLPMPLQQQQYRDSPALSAQKQAALPVQQPQAAAQDTPVQGTVRGATRQHGQQEEQPQQQQQQGSRHRSPQQQQEQLQDLQELAGILQPILYDDAAASEVLSEWLSGSDVAVAASPPGSDAATGPGNFVFQPPYMVPLQPDSAASTAGAAMAASPPVVPHMLHFTPLSTAAAGAAAAAAGGGGSVGWNSQQGGYSGDRSGIQYASPAPGSAAATAAGATPHSAAHKQQLWVQQGTPSTVAASQGYSTGRRTVGSSVAHGTPRHVELNPGSSVTVQRATAAEGDDQSLVLDIDLAKVLDSSGTIVLQVRRDETGALTAAAALAPAATPAGTKRAAAAAAAAAGVQAGGVPRAGGLVVGASPVIGGDWRQEQHQALPFGSISVDGSIGAAWAGAQQGTSSSQQQQHQHQQQGTEEEQPVHRVLRYSAEGRVSIGSFGGAVQDPAGPDGAWTNTADFSAVQQQQQQQVMVESLDFAVLQQQQQEESDGPCSHASGCRPLANASWVMVDIQPSGQLSREVSQAASTVAAAPGRQQQHQQEDAPAQVHSASAAAVKDATQMPEAASAPVPGADARSGTADATAQGGELHAQSANANFQQGLHPYQQALLLGAQGLSAPRTQRVSLEPPSTPLAGSVAGALLSMQASDLAGADQSSLWPSESVAFTEDGAGGPAGLNAAAAAAAVAPAGPTAASAATPAPAPGVGRSRGAVAEGGHATSPLPPELLPTETPAGFKFWGATAGRGAAGAGGLRYNAAQQTLESLSNLGVPAAPACQETATAAQEQAAQNGVKAGALTVAAPDSQQQQQHQQQLLQLGLLGQSLELLGLSEADLSQFGLNQISLDLLGMGQMQSLELQMLKALGAAAGVGEAGQLAQLPAARALAASAVKLLRKSMAVAASARQRTPAPNNQQQQQGPSELAAAAVAAAAAAMALNNTRQYQSLELLPRQLLQSLQAAATAEATGTAQFTAAGPQPAAAAAAATGAPQAEASQQEQQQLQGQESVVLPQEQQVGVRSSLTTWLADRFGADADLHKSVSLLLQELEQPQQQQQQQQQEEEEPQADEPQPAQQQYIVQQQQQQANESLDASQLQAAGSLSAEDPVAAHAASSQTPGRPHASTAEGADGGTAGAQSAAAAPTHADDKQQTAVKAVPAGSHTGAAVHDGDTSELCVTASPAPAWYAAMAQQQQQQQHLQLASDAQHVPGHSAPAFYQGGAAAAGQQQQQQEEEEEEKEEQQQPKQQQQEDEQGPEGSQGSWSNRVEQLLRITQNSPDVDSDGTGAVLTEGSLGMTPSPSGFRYGPNTGHERHAAQDTLPGVGGGEGASDLTAANLGAGESSVPSLFRTSVMTNPLYWVEPSSADLAGALAESAAVGATSAAAAVEGPVTAMVLADLNSAPPVTDAVEAAAKAELTAAAAAAAVTPEVQHTAEQAAAILQQYLPYSSSNSSSPCRDDDSASRQQQQQQQRSMQHHQAQPGEASAQIKSASAADTLAAGSDLGPAHLSQPVVPALGAADSAEAGGLLGYAGGELVGSQTGQGSPRTPRGVLYGSFCEAAAAESSGPHNSQSAAASAAKSAATGGGAGSGSKQKQLGLQAMRSAAHSDALSPVQDSAVQSVTLPYFENSAAGSEWQDWQQQQPQERQLNGSDAQGNALIRYEDSAAAGAEASPQDWQHQQPRWQVVSELDWMGPWAGHHHEGQGDTGLAGSLALDLAPWEQQQQTRQVLSNSPMPYTEVAAEGSWEDQQHWEKQQTGWQMLDELQQQQQQQLSFQQKEEEGDGEEWHFAEQQGAQVQLPEPQSVSRVQQLMQKLRDRRKLQQGTPGGGSPAAAAAAFAAEDAGFDAAPAMEEPTGSQVSSGIHSSDLSTAGSRDPAGVYEPEQRSRGPGVAQSAVGAGSTADSAESADSAPAVSSRGSVGLASAAEDTLCAAEAAMQQALLRVQLLHDQQQQQQHQHQQGMAELQGEVHADTQQQQQWQQQVPEVQLVQEQSAADRWQAWDVRMHLSEQQQQQQRLQAPAVFDQQQQQHADSALLPFLDTAATAVATEPVVHSPAAGNKQQLVQCMPMVASAGAGAAAATGGGGATAAQARAGAAAAAGTESPSVKWVREVLQDSSAFSSYMQDLARGDNTTQAESEPHNSHKPSRLAHKAQEAAAHASTVHGGDDAAAGSMSREGCKQKSGQLREQVAGKMSALLKAVQSGALRDSCAYSSSSSTIGSDAEGSEEDSGVFGSGVAEVGAAGPKHAGLQHSAWQDRIQQLLAAADAAADSLTQPPVLPPVQQRKAGAAAAAVLKPSVGKSAAVVRVPGVGLKYGLAAHKRPAAAAAAAGGGIANKNKSVVKPRARSVAASAQGQDGHVQAVHGAVQRLDKSKLTKAAAAAAIVAARHARPAGATAAKSAAQTAAGKAAMGTLAIEAQQQQQQQQQGLPYGEHSMQSKEQQQQQQETQHAQPSQDVVAAAVQGACVPDVDSTSTSSNQPKASSGSNAHPSTAAAKCRASFSLRSKPALTNQQQQEQQVRPSPVSQAAQHSRPSTSSGTAKPQPGPLHQPQTQQVFPGAAAAGSAAAVGQAPTRVGGVAVLAARQRERLQQLTQQRQQQQQQLAQHDVPQEHCLSVNPSAPAAAAAGIAGDRNGRGDGPYQVLSGSESRVHSVNRPAHVSSHGEQDPIAGASTNDDRASSANRRMRVSPEVRPEDSAVMHSPDAVYPPVSKAGKAKQQQVLLPAQGPLPVIVGAVGSSGASGAAGAAVAAAAGASKQAAGPKTTSMFDIERPKGYTFSTAKARATADLAGAAEQPAAVHQQYQQQQQQQAASTDIRHQGQVRPSRSLSPARRPGASSVAAAGAQASHRPTAVMRQSEAKGAQASAAAVPVAATPAALYRQNAGLQQEDSFSSQRSHGLSLRKGARQQASPAPAADMAVAAAGSRQQQKQEPDHVSGTARSARSPAAPTVPAVTAGRRQPQQQQQQQATGHTHVTLRSEHVATPEASHQRQMQPIVTRRPTNAARMGNSAGAPARVDSTPAGTVAAVAAVKAALAGFGTRGWQQQDVWLWLSKLRLDLLPEEPTAPLLSNPLRNGLLLAGIAASVTQQPLGGIRQPVATLAAARANLLTSAAVLSLVSAQFACSAAAAAARQDKDEALGGLGLMQRQQGLDTTQCNSPGFRGGRGRASMPGAALQGSPVRAHGCSSATRSPMKGGCSYGRSRSGSPNRSYQGALDCARGGSGGGGLALDTSSTCRCFVLVATGPGVHSLMGARGYHPYQQQQQQQQMSGELASVLTSPASSCYCDCWACQQLDGSVLEHAVLQLLELVMAGDTSCMWGLLYALQQAHPVIPGGMQGAARGASLVRGAGGAAGRLKGPACSPQKQSRQQQQQQQDALGGSAAVVEPGTGCIVVQPLQGPSWRSFQLPYTAAELTQLEQHLLQWLEDLDIICYTDTPDWSCLSSELASGVLLAEVAAALGLPHAVGIQERPVTAAARAGNIQAVLDVLQQLPELPCKWLLQQHNAALTAGERPALTALLEAIWVWTTGQPQQGSWLRWAQQQQQHVMPGRSSVGSTGSSVPKAAGVGASSSCRRVRTSGSVTRSARP